jgi:hypothetical protein
MNKLVPLAILFVLSTTILAQPIRLHPKNPHYFLYQSRPTILISSGEHYGAVINTDFNYITYLSTLQKDGLNLTRLFCGAYIENNEAFNITRNTLAPTSGKLLVPWARSEEAGYKGGGNKFDLDSWDQAYFNRLKDFLKTAADKGIIVELTLFSSYYNDGQWQMSPLHYNNNITLTDSISYKKLQTPDNGKLMAYQEAYVRKMVGEVNSFDNIYFEIQNEPWSDHGKLAAVTTDYYSASDLKQAGNEWKKKIELASDASLKWQSRIAAIIQNEEKTFPKKHLISQNYCNFGFPLDAVDPAVSILNFHYALPFAATNNLHWKKAVGFNETGFAGTDHNIYRRQAWRFVMSGGALFNNLDYSFCAGNEDGSNTNIPDHSTGSASLRKELSYLVKCMNRMPLTDMKADNNFIKASPGAFSYGMASSNKSVYLVYLEYYKTIEAELILEKARYKIEWLDTKTGILSEALVVDHRGGALRIGKTTEPGGEAVAIVTKQ